MAVEATEMEEPLSTDGDVKATETEEPSSGDEDIEMPDASGGGILIVLAMPAIMTMVVSFFYGEAVSYSSRGIPKSLSPSSECTTSRAYCEGQCTWG